jgi:twitching motility two-component system response regulator PilH
LARKILLADDSVTAQNMGRKILADAGYEVITVNNGSAALKKISEQKPDLIVLDVYMPGYSGLEVCQRLKETNETSRLPVLLTVGKLEPFKPEEAKRARADAFIVKPFEASELLSALSKLEDKIVPRGESSKPGRFSRVSAAIEEGRYDKTVAIEEDVGWKDRIAFPSKKIEKSASDDSDEAAAYNPPESERKSTEKRRAEAEESRVDLGALAPEGLPKDVTPEEIAALAAAAAQVKGKIAEAGTVESKQTQPALAVPQEDAILKQNSEENPVEKIEEKPEVLEDPSSEAASSVVPSPSDVIAALAGLNPNAAASHDAILETEFSANNNTPLEPAENEPVTMAVAAKTESGGETPRWKAVSVALDPEEAAISLEHEMQKAYAAYAAAETGHAASTAAVPESSSVKATPATTPSSPSETASSEPAVSIPALPAPEAAQTLTALANASTDAIRAAVQELEMVAESYLGEPAWPAIEPASAAQPIQLTPEAHQTLEAMANDAASSATEQPQPEAAKSDTSIHHESDSHAEPKHEAPKPEESSAAAASTRSTFVNQIPAERASERQAPSYTEAAADGSPRVQDKESDSTTAAAWASWRRIRESGNPKEAASEQEAPQDSAAMAVAAGAEKAPEDASAGSDSDPAEIASIVESVLANLRPKIVEEISRKMGKKK